MNQPTAPFRAPQHSTNNKQRWAIRLTTAGVLSGMLLNAAVPNGDAAVFTPELRNAALNPAAKTEVAKKKRTAPKAAETYQERQDRVADSKRSMLRPLGANEGQDTTCVTGEFTTLGVVFDSVMESLLPMIPANLRGAAQQNQKAVRAAMGDVTVSALAISTHPNSRGTDADDPQYRSAISQLVVDNLLKIRDGEHNDAIPVANITLSQAVESTWLYVFAGVLAPLGFALQVAPNLGSAGPLPIGINQLLNFALTGSRLALQYLYQGTSRSILNQCIAQVTEEQKDQAGKPSDTVTYDIPIHPLIEGAANQLALADNDTCKPIGDKTLGEILERTAEQAKAQAPNAAAKARIDAQAKSVARQLKSVRVPHNLIPADPSDWSQAESMISMIGPVLLSALPSIGGLATNIPQVGTAIEPFLGFLDLPGYLGGAPLDILIGLGHNIGQGDNLTETVTVYDLTVTKSLTATYFAYHFSLYLVSTVGGILEGELLPAPTAGSISPTRIITAVLGLPLTYGLVTFHHVVRTMCFVEDDLTGTGLGAEANKKDPEAHAEAVAAKKAKDAADAEKKAPATKRQRSSANKTAEKTTEQQSLIPGLKLPTQIIPGLK